MTHKTKQRLKKFLLILLSALFTILTTSTVNCKPTLPFSLPPSFQISFPSWPTFKQLIEKRQIDAMKSYSGRRLAADSLRMIYHNDQTIAIVELGPEKLLLSCELIEIYNDDEGKVLLQKLARINRPFKINFKDMLRLMQQCDRVDRNHDFSKRKASNVAALYDRNGETEESESNVNIQSDAPAPVAHEEETNPKGLLAGNPFSVFSGVFPGTKWCGTGDIAKNYHDLGTEKNTDRCCRDHDICPVKIRAYQSRYNLTNDSIYTKSHCICDDLLFQCLKATNSSTSQLMGTIYFNLVQVPCIAEGQTGQMMFRTSREGF